MHFWEMQTMVCNHMTTDIVYPNCTYDRLYNCDSLLYVWQSHSRYTRIIWLHYHVWYNVRLVSECHLLTLWCHNKESILENKWQDVNATHRLKMECGKTGSHWDWTQVAGLSCQCSNYWATITHDFQLPPPLSVWHTLVAVRCETAVMIAVPPKQY